mmetsp:Transcript_44245/g.114956  ORF Transcript_44245/g.114956 Transcript_44245/m.114956 type:complete len:214 (-) Transcript_44245:80-721(-)
MLLPRMADGAFLSILPRGIAFLISICLSPIVCVVAKRGSTELSSTKVTNPNPLLFPLCLSIITSASATSPKAWKYPFSPSESRFPGMPPTKTRLTFVSATDTPGSLPCTSGTAFFASTFRSRMDRAMPAVVSASSSVSNVTKPNPRGFPFGLRIITASTTVPYFSNSFLNSFSSTSQGIPPINSFRLSMDAVVCLLIPICPTGTRCPHPSLGR